MLQKINIWSFLRLIVLSIIILQFLDAGVDARRKRKRRNRNKRIQGKNAGNNTLNAELDRATRKSEKKERKSRHKSDKIDEEVADVNWPSPTLVQLYRIQQMKVQKNRAESAFRTDPTKLKYAPGHMIRQLRNKMERPATVAPVIDDSVPVLTHVQAKIDFMIPRQKSRHFYIPTSTISTVTSSEVGLVAVHSATGKFGIHSAAQAVFGRLIHVTDPGRSDSHFGCGHTVDKAQIPPNNEPWVALIARGHCAFFTKIKLAERHNATAVIIYDNKDGEVPEMFTLGTSIISLAISKHDGHKMAKLADSGTKVLVNIAVDEGETETTAFDHSILDGMNTLAKESRDGPENCATSFNGVEALTLLFAILAMLFQHHVTN